MDVAREIRSILAREYRIAIEKEDVGWVVYDIATTQRHIPDPNAVFYDAFRFAMNIIEARTPESKS